MKVWKQTRWDATLLALSVSHFAVCLLMAFTWAYLSPALRLVSFGFLVFAIVYNVIIVAHLFTHVPWFESPTLNALASMLNSVNIGQSVQAYHLSHVHNHHRYNNDRKGPDGKTKDLSSTFKNETEHASLARYALLAAVSTLVQAVRAALAVGRLWRVGHHEKDLLLSARDPVKRSLDLRQVQLDRVAHCIALLLFLSISWEWTIFCYLPAFYIAFVLVNVQNYGEHYGARPEDRFADSVSYYGRIYNLLTFNDGYHQEHHLQPKAHWRQMPFVRRKHAHKLDQVERIVSPVPAMLAVFHFNRPQLQRVRLK